MLPLFVAVFRFAFAPSAPFPECFRFFFGLSATFFVWTLFLLCLCLSRFVSGHSRRPPSVFSFFLFSFSFYAIPFFRLAAPLPHGSLFGHSSLLSPSFPFFWAPHIWFRHRLLRVSLLLLSPPFDRGLFSHGYARFWILLCPVSLSFSRSTFTNYPLLCYLRSALPLSLALRSSVSLFLLFFPFLGSSLRRAAQAFLSLAPASFFSGLDLAVASPPQHLSNRFLLPSFHVVFFFCYAGTAVSRFTGASSFLSPFCLYGFLSGHTFTPFYLFPCHLRLVAVVPPSLPPLHPPFALLFAVFTFMTFVISVCPVCWLFLTVFWRWLRFGSPVHSVRLYVCPLAHITACSLPPTLIALSSFSPMLLLRGGHWRHCPLLLLGLASPSVVVALLPP